MLFHTIDFAIFLPLVYLVYWFALKKYRIYQNLFLLFASYVFYGWWDWRFLILIMASSLIDFTVGKVLAKTEETRKRKGLLAVSLIVNIGLLGFFKYFNFFTHSFAEAFSFLGASFEAKRLNIILPVGISFYTFQTLSYTIDVYRKKIAPTNNWISFFAFVGFFPQLVAGPIERASNLLPQFNRERTFNYEETVDGLRQMLWGFFKKIVIADNAAIYANDIFANYQDYSGSTLLLGAFFFSLQIYGDFSGYSDIAIGTARLFGFQLMQNFKAPYFSRDIAEYWRRWHISLTSWFKDYVYIPLGGSRVKTGVKIRNVFIIFLVSGLWHGANWTFVAWGFLNAALFLPIMLMKRNRRYTSTVAEGRILPSLKELYQILSTFLMVILIKIFFRADSIGLAFEYIAGIFSPTLISSPMRDLWTMNSGYHIFYFTFNVVVFIIVEWLQREKRHGLEFGPSSMPRAFRWGVYYLVIISCLFLKGLPQEFIYFQF